MELAMQKLSITLFNPLMTDQEFTEEILFLREFPLHSIMVLPYNVARAKQLMMGTTIQVGSFVDYPLGSGTYAKQAFEVGQLYEDGALEVFVTTTTNQLENEQYHYRLLKQLAFSNNKIGLFINTKTMKNAEKASVAANMVNWPIRSMILGNNLTTEQAIQDMSIFSTSKSKQTSIQVNVEAPSLLEIEFLLQSGASYIGITNGREILSLFSKKK